MAVREEVRENSSNQCQASVISTALSNNVEAKNNNNNKILNATQRVTKDQDSHIASQERKANGV